MSRKLFVILLLGAALIVGALAQSPNTAAKRISVSIDASKTAAPISPYIYGQFIEHIADTVNRSLWAEMIDDRKFYYDINSKPSDRKPVRGRVANLWRPIGPDESVTMDQATRLHRPAQPDHQAGRRGAARNRAGRHRPAQRPGLQRTRGAGGRHRGKRHREPRSGAPARMIARRFPSRACNPPTPNSL